MSRVAIEGCTIILDDDAERLEVRTNDDLGIDAKVLMDLLYAWVMERGHDTVRIGLDHPHRVSIEFFDGFHKEFDNPIEPAHEVYRRQTMMKYMTREDYGMEDDNDG